MSEIPAKSLYPALEPMDRISEVLFGLIMVLTCTGTLGVATADRMQIRTMLIGALGCNLAWGIIDAGMFLMGRLHEQGRNISILRSVRDSSPEAAQSVIANALPSILGSILSQEQLELIRKRLIELPDPSTFPILTTKDGVGAIAVFFLVVLSTFPVTIPFVLFDDARFALRFSNLIAVAMLFVCGYLIGHYSGLRKWVMGAGCVAVGGALVLIAIVLGG